jgi:hypothetical protein
LRRSLGCAPTTLCASASGPCALGSRQTRR